MPEWLQNSEFKGPADAAASAPRASLRLNHVETITRVYLDDPSFDMNDESVPCDVREIAKNRQRLAEERKRKARDRMRERAELRFGSFTYALCSEGQARIVAYSGCEPVVDIPDFIEGNRVVALSSGLFSEHEELSVVNIPDTVEVVGHRLFEKCVNLRQVRLSAALAQVGSNAFLGCECFDVVQINAPCPSAEMKLLSGARVSRIDFGSQVRNVDTSGLSVRELASISVSVENPFLSTDGAALFSHDGKTLMRMVVPQAGYEVLPGCEKIADKAFDSVCALESITLPDTLRFIGNLAFAKTSLRAIEFPCGLEEIAPKAFFFCSRLEHVALPDGLRVLGDEAFASSGVKNALLPSGIERFGVRVFDKTPAQKNIAHKSVLVLPVYGAQGNAYSGEHGALDANHAAQEGAPGLRIDACGGVYQGETFLELFGLVESYCIAHGTKRVAPGACKRHKTLRSVVVPEGVVEIGDDAFRGSRALHSVSLPETLCSLGARALFDTSVRTLRIGPSVQHIGDCALVIQGDNPFLGSGCALDVDLDSRNRHFYKESGLLCERGAGRAKGDAVVVYVGPDRVVRIPEAVTQIDAYAFCGLEGIEELHLHSRIQSICTGALSTRRAVRMLYLELDESDEPDGPGGSSDSGEFGEPGAFVGSDESDGHARQIRQVRLIMPGYTSRYRSMMPLFDTKNSQIRFNFEYYDTWVANSHSMAEFAPAAFERLKNPVHLCARCRDLYEGLFVRKAQAVCAYFASRGDIGALEQLYAWGYVGLEQIESQLADVLDSGDAQTIACLLELRRRLSNARSSRAFAFDLDL